MVTAGSFDVDRIPNWVGVVSAKGRSAAPGGTGGGWGGNTEPSSSAYRSLLARPLCLPITALRWRSTRELVNGDEGEPLPREGRVHCLPAIGQGKSP